ARAATFQGRVLGPAGVPVADARVAIDGDGGGLHRATSTDGDGRFTFPELAPGRYSLVCERDGFASQRLTNLELAVGQTFRIDVVLQLAGAAESIETVTSAPTLAT